MLVSLLNRAITPAIEKEIELTFKVVSDDTISESVGNQKKAFDDWVGREPFTVTKRQTMADKFTEAASAGKVVKSMFHNLDKLKDSIF